MSIIQYGYIFLLCPYLLLYDELLFHDEAMAGGKHPGGEDLDNKVVTHLADV